MVKPEQVNEDQMVILARDLAKKIEEEMEYPGQIKVNRHPRDEVRRIRKVINHRKTPPRNRSLGEFCCSK